MFNQIITAFTLIFSVHLASAGVSLSISDINHETVKYKRAGIIPIGIESMLFSDQSGKEYEISCGGDKLNLRLFKKGGLSDFMINSSLENCNQRIFVDLKEQILLGFKIDSIVFTLTNKTLKSGKPSPLTELQFEVF